MRKIGLAYAVSFGLLGAVLFIVVRQSLDESPFPGGEGRSLLVRLLHGLQDPVSQVLLQITLIIVLARVFGALFQRIGQPAVVGEMLAGIALGPSLLGSVAPDLSAFLFPPSSLPNLSTLSQVGIMLFMFGVGLELNMREFKHLAKSALLVSNMGIAVPFSLGALSSLWLYHTYKGTGTSFLAFALFMGISMSITAFPVLARMIQERKLLETRVGTTVITAAAIDDVSAWCALAVIVALARANSPVRALWTLALTAACVLIAFFVVRPLLQRSKLASDEDPTASTMVVALACAFSLALCTQVIGIHSFFGAFVAGLIMPQSARLRAALHERLYHVSSLVLVPVFFAFTGLRTELGLLHGAPEWLTCLLLLLVAIAGKFGGSMIAARIGGLSWRESAGVGALMNTRGLVELIALNVGLDMGVLSPSIFAMLVLMALATTFMTGPIVSLLKLRPETASTPAIDAA